MTSTRSSSTSAKTRSTTRRIEAFRQRFGDGHVYLACHAALPLALTPDLLYSLWANFQRDTDGEAIEIPWIAVADLMLSNLCKEVGNELYEMDQPIRDDLLSQLQSDPRFGLERVRELADFVMAYVEQQLDSPDLDVRDLATGQKWRALAYKHPSEAAHSIATVLAQLALNDKAEWIRMAALVNSLAAPLAAFQPLLNYIRAMAELARGNLAAATAQMTQAVDANREVRVEGVNLPIPDVLNGTLPKSNESDVLPTSPPNRLKMPIAIAGGTIVSVLLLIGVQYGLRSPDAQRTPDVTSSATPSPQSSPSASPQSRKTPSLSPSQSTPNPSPSITSSSQPLPSASQGVLTASTQPSKPVAPTTAPASTPTPITLPQKAPHQGSTPTTATPSVPGTASPIPSSIQSKPSPDLKQSLPASVELPVPYLSVRDNVYKYYATSKSTSLAMALSYYGVKPKTPRVRLADELYQKYQELAPDSETNWSMTTLVAKAYGFEAFWDVSMTLAQVKQQLASGHPVIAQLMVTTAHTNTVDVCVIGYTQSGLIVNDPWGNPLTGYTNTDGSRVLLTNEFLNRVFFDTNGAGWAMSVAPVNSIDSQSPPNSVKSDSLLERRLGGGTR